MHDVVVYLSSIHKQTPGRKIDTLRAFAEGAKKCGANVHIESQHVFRPAKLAVILGWPSPIQTTHNIKLRAEIVAKQRQTGNHVLSVDANCFKFHFFCFHSQIYFFNGICQLQASRVGDLAVLYRFKYLMKSQK